MREAYEVEGMVSRNGMVWGFQNAMLEVLDEVHEVATASVRVRWIPESANCNLSTLD